MKIDKRKELQKQVGKFPRPMLDMRMLIKISLILGNYIFDRLYFLMIKEINLFRHLCKFHIFQRSIQDEYR